MSKLPDPLALGLEVAGIAVLYAVVVLIALSLTIKALTKVFRPRGEAAVGLSGGEGRRARAEDDTLLLALAAVAVHKYLSEKALSTLRGGLGVIRMSPWVSSWRAESRLGMEVGVRARRRYPYE